MNDLLAPEVDVPPVSEIDRQAFREMAIALGRQIAERRVEEKEGTISWQVPRMVTVDGPIEMMPVGSHLYEGRDGIAFFFAALEKAQPGEGWGDLGRATAAPTRLAFRKVLSTPERRREAKVGLGGIFGLGGLIYTFSRAASFLGDEDWLEETRRMASLVTPERLAVFSCNDVVTGTAGMAGALLVLHDLSPAPLPDCGATPLELAEICGEKLVAERVTFENRPRAWVSNPKFPPLSGYSHGAAGVAEMLIRIHRRTGRAEFLDAAMEGLAFERTTYSPRFRNWLDLRRGPLKGEGCLNNWCHGAPGIALGRLGALGGEEDPRLRAELAIALETTWSQPLTRCDHVCCGNMGRAEILFEAARQLGSEDLLERALGLAQQVIAKGGPALELEWQLAAGFDPGFFTGAAGAGYAFLRLADPISFPCVLNLS